MPITIASTAATIVRTMGRCLFMSAAACCGRVKAVSAAVLSIRRRDPNAFSPRTTRRLTIGDPGTRLSQSLQVLDQCSEERAGRERSGHAGERRHESDGPGSRAGPHPARRRAADVAPQGRRGRRDGPRQRRARGSSPSATSSPRSAPARTRRGARRRPPDERRRRTPRRTGLWRRPPRRWCGAAFAI